MAKKEIYTRSELLKVLEVKRGYLVIHRCYNSAAKKTIMHYPSCPSMNNLLKSSYGNNPNLKIGQSSKKIYRHYDFYKEIYQDYFEFYACNHCIPIKSYCTK